VAVVALPGMLSLELGIPVHAFDFDAYAVTVCGEGAVEEGQAHITISPPAGLDALVTADTVISSLAGRASSSPQLLAC
jgi:hypothetical protein